MNKHNRWRVLPGLMAVVMATAVIVASGTTSYAQWGNNRSYDTYPNWGGSFDLRQTALNAGFNEGTEAGNKDRSRGRRNYNDHSEYRSASKDYSSRFGDRGLYQRYFRIAFERGYDAQFGIARNDGWNDNRNDRVWNDNRNDRIGNDNRGGWNNNGNWDRNNRRGRNWDRYGNFGGSFQLRQTALNAGYNEGVKQGLRDRNRGPRDLREFQKYRDARDDYTARNGDFSLHQRYYREGFENGYYDGLNGY
jgi:hypothetical protein